MAGKSIADMKKRLPQVTRFVRAMPNTPAAIGRGITGAFATEALTKADRAAVTRLLQTTGRLEWVENEGLIDAVTAVSGSGPPMCSTWSRLWRRRAKRSASNRALPAPRARHHRRRR